jgi:Ala-tRNA(Pro) deacylase
MHTPLFEMFDRLNISYKNFTHRAIFTVEEGEDLRKTLPGAHTKNLFLTNKKETIYLISMLDDQRLDLKNFRKLMQEKDLTFASAELLKELLHLIPGSVTPYGLIHAPQGSVKFILDADLMSYEAFDFHPLRNDMTVNVAKEDFLRFFEAIQHKPQILPLPKLRNPLPVTQ